MCAHVYRKLASLQRGRTRNAGCVLQNPSFDACGRVGRMCTTRVRRLFGSLQVSACPGEVHRGNRIGPTIADSHQSLRRLANHVHGVAGRAASRCVSHPRIYMPVSLPTLEPLSLAVCVNHCRQSVCPMYFAVFPPFLAAVSVCYCWQTVAAVEKTVLFELF